MTEKLKLEMFELYLDLDGVFADFDKGVHKLTGMWPYELGTKRLWSAIHRKPDFFLSLDMMEGADILWDVCKKFNPTFLTGAPSSQAFRDQKVLWTGRKFGPEYKTIVLPKKEKQLYSGPHKMLLDDTPINIEQWVAKGGYGVLHEGNVHKTIEQLEEIVKLYE